MTMEMQEQEKKIYIKTYGCQMNMYDSEKMQELMAEQGFGVTEEVADGDLVVLNTCHIREKAAEKMYSELGRIRKIKEKRKNDGKNTVIAVAGCVAQAEGAEIRARAPYVDVIVGPQSYQRLPGLVKNAEKGAKKGVDLDFSTIGKFDFLDEEVEKEQQKASPFEVKASAFLTIQEGCDKFCTFCVVPYTRGAEYSRSVAEIYREALRLAERGTKEINLLGQNVNAYHGIGPNGETWTLGKLIRHIAEIPQIERIRYTTSHPRDVDDDLIEAHRDVEKLMPFLHLPVQSGSDNILKQMNRKHTADEYRRIIDRFREAQPDIEFSSDFIVGYPGETEQDFRDTMKLVEDVNFSLSYSFIYSARPGTPAANESDDTPKQVKTERLQELQALLEKQMLDHARAKVGKTLPILVNRKGKYEGQIQGTTPYMQPVILQDNGELMNKIVDVEITELKDRALLGSV
jgi:tRNA-2-methylthio-N6-dimethylallyladenosine synthase